MSKFWNFKNAIEGQDVELRIDGDIVDGDDAWLYEWLGMKCASPNSFRDELAQHSGKNLSVWIDSYGGSVFAAAGIYNALMEHKKTGAKVTTIIDGKAMSAAGTIWMAGDERKISPGGVFMMHNPLTYASGYAADLRKAASVLDVVKECIVNAYQIATGLASDKISALMDDETYMSAKTAIKNGFATAMLCVEQADQSEKGKDEPMNFSFSRMAIQNAADDSMKNFAAVVKKFNDMQASPPPQRTKESIMDEAKKLLSTVVNMLAPKNTENEEESMEIKNIEDLKKAYPDMVNQISAEAVANAVANEKGRITALDALADEKNPMVQELIADAKNTGKTANDIKAVVDIAKKHAPAPDPKNKGNEAIVNAIKDSAASGVNSVGAEVPGGEQQEALAAINVMVSVLNGKTQNGGKK